MWLCICIEKIAGGPQQFLIPDTCPDFSCLIFHSRFLFRLGLYVDIPVCLKDSRRSQRKEEKEDPARCLLRIAAAAEFRHLLGDGLCATT
jgi:hypothetical protein